MAIFTRVEKFRGQAKTTKILHGNGERGAGIAGAGSERWRCLYIEMYIGALGNNGV